MTSGYRKERIVEGVYDPSSEEKYNPHPALNHLSNHLDSLNLESRVEKGSVIAKDSSTNTKVKAYFNPLENGNPEGKGKMICTIDVNGKGKGQARGEMK